TDVPVRARRSRLIRSNTLPLPGRPPLGRPGTGSKRVAREVAASVVSEWIYAEHPDASRFLHVASAMLMNPCLVAHYCLDYSPIIHYTPPFPGPITLDRRVVDALTDRRGACARPRGWVGMDDEPGCAVEALADP